MNKCCRLFWTFSVLLSFSYLPFSHFHIYSLRTQNNSKNIVDSQSYRLKEGLLHNN